MNTVNHQGINRNYTLNYGQGPKGQGGAAKLTVENEKTGATRSLSGFRATNGEQSVGGVAYSGPKVQAGAIAASGPKGAVGVAGLQGPHHSYGAAGSYNANTDIARVWKAYV